MSPSETKSGFANIHAAQIYYEIAGSGAPFFMIHAGVADNRQWNNEFEYFSQHYHVLRYDQRGFGQSEPVTGDFRHLDDLLALLEHVGLRGPLILMGCSMGGGLAMDFALAYPARVKALIMAGSGPSGLDLDVPKPAKFAEIVAADEAHDWDRIAELEMEIWFDGEGRSPDQVDPVMRKLAYDMNRIALTHEARELGKRLPDAEVPAAGRLGELQAPVLIVVGVHDTPYIRAAADYMLEHLPSAQKVVIQDAAHLSNMEHPEEFRRIVETFLKEIEL